MTDEFHGLLIIMVVIWVFGKIFRALSMPVLLGELLGGALVGPLVFGLVSPNNEVITVLAELGVFFLILHTGLETDARELMKSTKASMMTAVVDIFLPFIATILVGYYWLDLPFKTALFAAVAISATAIAIVSRSLKELKLSETPIGTQIIGTAVFSEILVLILFSVILQVAVEDAFSWLNFGILIVKIVFFFTFVILGSMALQPYLQKFTRRKGFTFTLILGLGLGLLAEGLGLHIIIGAFLAGVMIRQDFTEPKIFNKIEDRIYGLSYSFLGPIFFTSLAFSLTPNVFTSSFSVFGALFLAAYVTKFIGTCLLVWYQTKNLRDGAITGFTLNNRGVVDLIMASIGLQAGIIDQNLFAVLVLFAFSSTLISSIGLKVLTRNLPTND